MTTIAISMTNTILILTVTAYCHCARCCGKANQPTASGATPLAGRTIAASRSIPFGTVIDLPGIGLRRVEDRLSRRFDNRIDLFMPSHQQALQFGKQKLAVTVRPVTLPASKNLPR